MDPAKAHISKKILRRGHQPLHFQRDARAEATNAQRPGRSFAATGNASRHAPAPDASCPRATMDGTGKHSQSQTSSLASVSGPFYSYVYVLFNFPSLYWFAIGFQMIFSFTRCLPRVQTPFPRSPTLASRNHKRQFVYRKRTWTGLSPSLIPHSKRN